MSLLGGGILRRLLVVGLALGVTALGVSALGTASGQGAVMRVQSPSSWATNGGNLQVTIRVEGVQNLGAYEWGIAFDPAVLEYVSVENRPFLGSTGRSVYCPAPILDVGSVRFGCATAGATPYGPLGSDVLSTLTLSPVAPGQTTLSFALAGLSNELGDSIDVTAVGGCIVITAPGTTSPGCPTPTPKPPEPTPTPPPPGTTPVPPGSTSVPTPSPTAVPTSAGPTPTPTPLPPGLEAVPLAAGCNPVTATYPDNTPVQTIVDAVGPAGSLISHWLFDVGTWRAFSPQYPQVSDLTEIDLLNVVFVCVREPGAFVRPII